MASALIVIDPQVGWQHESVAEAFDNALSCAQSFEGPIVLTRFINPPDSRFVSQLNWRRFSDEADAKLIDQFAELEASVFDHPSYTCLTDDLQHFLESNEITQVYVAGVFTDVCVTLTAMELFDHDYDTYVLEDCIGTLHGQDVHLATLKSLRQILGSRHVIHSQAM